MENKIIDTLDNLTTEQTERLLNENMNLKISDNESKRIKNSVFQELGLKQKKRYFIQKKVIACIAAFAIIFTSLFIIGFDNVTAAIKNIFTFTPGIGITENNDDIIFTMNPITRQIKANDATANIISAIYSEDYLNVTIEVIGKEVHSDAFLIYHNDQTPIKLDSDNFMDGYTLCSSTDSTMLVFSYKANAPTDDDTYEIAISGFSKRLSFNMTPCNEYEDIKEIGPTDIQNGISITTSAQKLDNQLVVWCYPFNVSKKINDTILGYGKSFNSSFNLSNYIDINGEKIYDTSSGFNLSERMRFDVPEDIDNAVLHIPYLAMLREENLKLIVNIPKEYGTIESETEIKCSLGTIEVKEIERVTNEYEADKDTVLIKFEFDSSDSNIKLYSFDFETVGKYLTNAIHFDSETGQLDFLEVSVDKDDKKVSLDISQLYYYMFGEYVIPLDIH